MDVGDEIVEDGFGGRWVKHGPDCDLQVVRPGKVECECPPERTPPDDTTEGLQAQIAKYLTDRNFMGWLLATGNSPLWETRTPEEEIARMAMVTIAPALERHRKAVEDAPGVAIWTGACVECGTPIELGDAITWRLRWSPQGPIHEECRRSDDTTDGRTPSGGK